MGAVRVFLWERNFIGTLFLSDLYKLLVTMNNPAFFFFLFPPIELQLILLCSIN